MFSNQVKDHTYQSIYLSIRLFFYLATRMSLFLSSTFLHLKLCINPPVCRPIYLFIFIVIECSLVSLYLSIIRSRYYLPICKGEKQITNFSFSFIYEELERLDYEALMRRIHKINLSKGQTLPILLLDSLLHH